MALRRSGQIAAGLGALAVAAGGLLVLPALDDHDAGDGWLIAALIVTVAGIFGGSWLLTRARVPPKLVLAAGCAVLGIGFLPLGPWGLIYLVAAAVLIGVWWWQRRQRLHWEAVGVATYGAVVESRRTGTVINNQSVVTKVTLRVGPPHSDEFTTTVRMVVPMGFDHTEGERILVLVDPARPGKAFVDRRSRTRHPSADRDGDHEERHPRQPDPPDEFMDTLALCAKVSEHELLGLTRVEHADRMSATEFAAALIRVPGWDDVFVGRLYEYCRREPSLALTILNLGSAVRDDVISRTDFDQSIQAWIDN